MKAYVCIALYRMQLYSQQTRLLFFGIFVGICTFILIRFIGNPNLDGNVFVWELGKTSSIFNNSKSAKKQEIPVRIYAIVITSPAGKNKKAVHVKATWAKRADGFTFISSEEDKDLPAIRATDKEGRSVLWEKTRKGFMYIYHNHLDKYDFFLKTDDDTYVIVENLKFLLSFLNASEPFILGRKLKFKNIIFPSGGAGYVLSRAAMKLMTEGMIGDTKTCAASLLPEDIRIGYCARDTGVKWIDSLDEHGLEVFHPFEVQHLISKASMESTPWIYRRNYYPLRTGFDCCSEHSVSFHYVKAENMYLMELLIYHLYPRRIIRELK
nr:glycoprotein N acetylgalactosamine [Hymenolepis microstoma]